MTAEDGAGAPPAGPEPVPGIAPDAPDAPDARAEAVVRAGRKARKSLREIAVDLFGVDPGSAACPGLDPGSGAGRVEAEWRPDGWLRARVRRMLQRARAAAKRGPGGG